MMARVWILSEVFLRLCRSSFRMIPLLDFSHLRTKGVRYAGHRNPPKEAIDAYPTGHDDTGFDPVRATVLQARLAACPGAFGGRDPCPRKEDRKLCLARNGVG